jgi:hypothetical protein
MKSQCNCCFSFFRLVGGTQQMLECWTTDRLVKKGLNHPHRCPLCDQEDETMNHLLISCVFTRIFWYMLLRKFGLHALASGHWPHILLRVVEGGCRGSAGNGQERAGFSHHFG